MRKTLLLLLVAALLAAPSAAQYLNPTNFPDPANAVCEILTYDTTAGALGFVGSGATGPVCIDTSGNVTLGSAAATAQLILPFFSDPATPTLAFGDGDSGFYESSDDTILVSTAGVQRVFFNINGMGGIIAGGPHFINEASTATNPSIAPNRADLATGLGGVSGEVSLITGGVEAVNIDASQKLTVASQLDDATGNEAAFTLNYTTNKATSGDDTGLVVNQTDTASPGTSYLAQFQVGGAIKQRFDASGSIQILDGQQFSWIGTSSSVSNTANVMTVAGNAGLILSAGTGVVSMPDNIGAAPAATCAAGTFWIDTDETDDTNCTTTADNSLCLCVATNTWVAFENN